MYGKLKARWAGGHIDKDTQEMVLSFRVPVSDLYLARGLVETLRSKMNEDPDLMLMVDKYSAPKSLNQIRFFWGLADKIAQKVGAASADVYLDLLASYGIFTFGTFEKDAAECMVDIYRSKEGIRLSRPIDEYEEQGRDIIELQLFKGISGYTKGEMSRLLEGTINEAKALDIDPDLVKRLLEG